MNKKVKHKDQRVGIFIDVSNMYMSAQHMYKTNVDFRQVMKTAVAGRKLVRAFAYVIETEEGKEKDFISALEDLGYEVRTKPLQIFKGGAKKGDWDVGLAIDVVRLTPLLDTVVLVSGDGDYVDLLEYLRGHGRRTEVIAFGETTSRRLLDEADEFIDLSEDKKRYLIGR
ncbi:MAG: NYN domain-containing protein [Candidatus Pacebacteria bacterium]|nr:NYN domain-containing protein [Candidatus Paceibacterota bacterium]